MWSKRAEPSGFPRNIWFTKVKMCYFSVLCVSISENWFIVNWFVCYFVPHLRLLCLISIQRNKSLSKPELTDPGGGFYRFPQICNRRIIFPPWQRQRCFQRKARRDLTSNDVQHRTNRQRPRRAGLVAQIKMEMYQNGKWIYRLLCFGLQGPSGFVTGEDRDRWGFGWKKSLPV